MRLKTFLGVLDTSEHVSGTFKGSKWPKCTLGSILEFRLGGPFLAWEPFRVTSNDQVSVQSCEQLQVYKPTVIFISLRRTYVCNIRSGTISFLWWLTPNRKSFQSGSARFTTTSDMGHMTKIRKFWLMRFKTFLGVLDTPEHVSGTFTGSKWPKLHSRANFGISTRRPFFGLRAILSHLQ